MTKRIDFLSDDDLFEQHNCEGTRNGGWVIFRCVQCAYERQLNLETGEIKLTQAGDPQALHRGFFYPPALQPEEYHPN